MEDNSQEQSNSRPWLYKKGQSGNPGGRKKGSISMKEWIRRKLQTMTPKEREVFLEGVPKEVIWKMAEGAPTNEITGKDGKDLIPEPVLKNKIDEAIIDYMNGHSTNSK